MTATTEPTSIHAGDTWKWRREDLTLYPATSYSLTYRFKNENGGFEITADPDGDFFAINWEAELTEAFAAGDYAWQAQVDGISGRTTVDQGTLTVLPSLFVGSATAALDTRSHARRALDFINATLEQAASQTQKEYEIRVNESWRRVVGRTWDDMIKAKAYYEGIVASEQAKEDVANGRPDKRRTYGRFRRGV